jgi:adenylate cyclase
MTLLYSAPDNREIELRGDGETILEASKFNKIPHTHACGGNARCSTCRVVILDGIESCLPRNEKEQRLASKLNFTPEIRLACQTQVQGNLTLRRLVLDHDDEAIADQEGSTPQMDVGVEKHLAILFSDIRGFTPFSEELLPYDVIHVLNRYYQLVGKPIHDNGGIINNFMGDGLMALFGVHSDENIAYHAVRAGLQMLNLMDKFKPYLQKVYNKSFDIGVGIHFGQVVFGTIGSGKFNTMTAIGSAVNLASRVESANKDLGSRLLITDSMYMELPDQLSIGKTAPVSLKGTSGETMLYEVLGLR